MLVAPHASKQLGRVNTIEAQGTLTKKLQWDPSSICMPKLLEGGNGTWRGGVGFHCCHLNN
jgi:hypothetical protein